ncbi:hypothetical protein HYC85_002173 [Camellia sinensis]|uniref:Uncharacterized protein n=1 Tax=Camellia sinensis TaxID=4442 RepID=A0A7J7I989_CAMSI|nr:hypothetical protein HYC85_002173 [Camellia sinensis]
MAKNAKPSKLNSKLKSKQNSLKIMIHKHDTSNNIKSSIVLHWLGQHNVNLRVCYGEFCSRHNLPLACYIQASNYSVLFLVEQVHLNRRDGIAKAPTIYPNPPLHQPLNYFPLRDDEAKNWAVGCICLIGHCLCPRLLAQAVLPVLEDLLHAWASRIVLQGPIVKKYPAQFSLASYTCFFGLVQFLAIAAFLERDLQAWQIHSTSELLAFFYMFVECNVISNAFILDGGFPYPYRYGSLTGEAQSLLQHSCLCKRCSRLWCSIIGAVFVIAGLYLVVWGKSAESKFAAEKAGTIQDQDKLQVSARTYIRLIDRLLRKPAGNEILTSSTNFCWHRS